MSLVSFRNELQMHLDKAFQQIKLTDWAIMFPHREVPNVREIC